LTASKVNNRAAALKQKTSLCTCPSSMRSGCKCQASQTIARQTTEAGLDSMQTILMPLYAVGVILLAAAFALALVRWVIDRVAALTAKH
jgi:hypothetical protein